MSEPLVLILLQIFGWLQISYGLFNLTNTLKMAFVLSKDDKRLVFNLVMAVANGNIMFLVLLEN